MSNPWPKRKKFLVLGLCLLAALFTLPYAVPSVGDYLNTLVNQWRLEQMYTPALRRHVERYGRYMLSCIRLQYAWARLVERDAAKAEALLARAGEVYAGSPVKGEADAEMELIRWVETIEP